MRVATVVLLALMIAACTESGALLTGTWVLPHADGSRSEFVFDRNGSGSRRYWSADQRCKADLRGIDWSARGSKVRITQDLSSTEQGVVYDVTAVVNASLSRTVGGQRLLLIEGYDGAFHMVDGPPKDCSN